MAVPSDLPPVVESVTVGLFYFIGALSLIVNSTTLVVIICKGAKLDSEIRMLSAFHQVCCIVHNLFTTILFIPFLYPKAGAGYCMGALSGLLEYQRQFEIFTALTMLMFSSFGMLIIARQQKLLFDGSWLKCSGAVRKLSYVLSLAFFQCGSLLVALSSDSQRVRQERDLAEIYPYLKWRERGLNWYKFTISNSADAFAIIKFGFRVVFPAGCALVFLPYVHMIIIVIRSGQRGRHVRQQNVRNARIVVIQFLVLLVFLVIPMSVGFALCFRNGVYADSQIAMVVAEWLFACSSLVNSYVIVARNRIYRASITSIFRRNHLNKSSVSVNSPIQH